MKKNSLLMFVQFIFGTLASRLGDFCTALHLLCEKHIKLFRMCGGYYSFRNMKYIESTIFPEVNFTNVLI